MSHRCDEKSAQEECCMNEGGRDHAEHGDRINPLVPCVVPQLSVVSDSTTSSQTSVMSLNKKLYRIPPRRLAFCGGGVRCVAHVGVLKTLDSAGLLKCVKEVIGVSAGALFALLYALDYSIQQIEELSLNFDFRVLGDINPEELFLFPMTFGLNSGDMLDKLIGSILFQKGFSKDITFAELSKSCSISFRCYAAELQTSAVKEMCAKTTPSMMVRTAVRASMSLPIMYSPVKDGDSLLVDGGLLHNMPMVFLTEEEIQETWGVLFVNRQSKIQAVESVINFFQYIYDGSVIMRNVLFIKKYKERLILVKSDGFDVFNYGESKKNKIEFIKRVEATTWKFLTAATRPARRFSVS
jgi:predicted acylesterase/phospholipase RssA